MARIWSAGRRSFVLGALTLLLVPTGANAASYAEDVLSEPSLAGYWRLGETFGTMAVAARGADGTYVGAPLLGSPSLLRSDTVNAAVDFDGIDDQVRIPDGSSSEFAGAFTLEAWVRMDGTTGKARQVLTKPGAYQLALDPSGHWYFSIYSGGVEKAWTDAWEEPALAPGQRVHLVATYDGAWLRLYADGALVSADRGSWSMDDVAATLQIGAWNTGGSWDGAIDDVATYSSALSSATIRRHFEIGDDATPPSKPVALNASAGDGRVVLDWEDNPEGDIDRYDVYRSVDGGPAALINTAPQRESSFLDTDVVNDTTATYSVRAVDRAGHVSPASDPVDARPRSRRAYRYTVLGHDSVRGYWRLGDSTGTTAAATKGPNGSYLGGPALGTPSLLASDTDPAVGFDGVDDYVRIPDGPAVDVSSAFTLEAWVRPDAAKGMQVVTKPGAFQINISDRQQWYVGIRLAGVERGVATADGTAAAGKLAHIVATYDGAVLRLYQDGVQKNTNALSGPIDEVAADLYFATWSGAASFQGALDDVALYDQALSASDIAEHFRMGTDGSAPAPPADLRSAGGDRQVELDWANNQEPDVAGYDLFRATAAGGPYEQLNGAPLSDSKFVDRHVLNERKYFYVVKAVDRAGLTSAASAETGALPQTPSAYSDAISGHPALQGYWRLSDPASDVAAAVRGPDGTYRHGATPGFRGLLARDSNTAVDLDGARHYVKVPDADGLDATSSFAVEAWVRADELPSDGSSSWIVTKPSTYWLGVDPNGMWRMGYAGTAGWRHLIATTGPVVGATYHLVGTYDGSTMRLYVNGALVSSLSSPGTVIPTQHSLSLGAWDGKDTFAGAIDETAIYDDALTADTIATHYRIGAAGTPPSPPTSLTAAASDEHVTLNWAPNPEPDLAGYHVFRAEVAGGPYTRITDQPITGSALTDKGRSNNQTYFYVVRAVDRHGESSAASSEAAATPRAPTRYRDTVKGRDGLLGYWRLDETSGTRAAPVLGTDGTYEGGPRQGIAGLLRSDDNKAAGFGVLRQNVSVADSPDLTLATAGSVEAWIRLDQPLTRSENIMGREGAYDIGFTSDGRPKFVMISGSVWHTITGPTVLAAERAYHVVGTFDGQTQRLYIDGVQVATGQHTSATTDVTVPLRIGSRDHYWSIPGTVDEPAVYTTALSAAQVAEHHALGRDGEGPGAISGLSAEAGNARVVLDWAASDASDLAGYDVFRARSASGPFEKRNGEPVTVSTFTDTEVSNGETYFYVVRAVDKAGNRSAASPQAKATPTGVPQLFEPETVHSNGADLRWTRFAETDSGTFRSYEIHRSRDAGFTPSPQTRIASIGDVDTTTYRDVTAAAGATFTYRVVTNGVPSQAQTVDLTADGHARKLLQPEAARARATYMRGGTCANRGADGSLRVGTAAGDRVRGLLRFDLADIPAGASVNAASLSVYLRNPATSAMTVAAHRATAEWQEGTGRGDCTGDGASWNEANGGIAWATPGGDMADTASAQVSHGANDAAGWDTFDVSGAVQSWARLASPNHGFILKAGDESTSTVLASYASDDASEPSLRPKLSVTYTDGSHARAPDVAISAPGDGERVRGTQTVEAGASDDGRVDKVELFVGGDSIGTDTTAPYRFDWDTKSAANGTKQLTAKATDEAGNVSTSAAVAVTVSNSAPPTTAITAPATRYRQAVLNDTPAGYWRLDESAGTALADVSGNGRNGTLSGTYLLSQPGLLTGETNTAISFRNATTDGQASLGGFGSALGTQVTAEALVNYSALATSNAHNRVVSRGWGSTGGWMLSVYRDSSNIQRAYWAINKSGTLQVAQAAVTPGRLHLAGSYDGATMRLFVNGNEVASRAAGAVPLNTTAAPLLGQTVQADTLIDDAAIYAGAPPARERFFAHSELSSGRSEPVKGSFTARADAADDLGVEKVEFFLGDDLLGEDTTAPYSTTADTLSASAPIYDGTYQVTSKAHDTSGQVTVSSPVEIRVANGTGTKYMADFASTPAPISVTFDGAAGATQEAHPLDVTVTNRSASTWSATSTVVRPRWIATDGTATAAGADVALSADLAPNGQQTRRVSVTAPALPEGVEQSDYTLRVDLVDTAASATFASTGNKPLEHVISVVRKARVEPGLERYYHYEGEELGAGMQHLVNVASGNSLVRWTPFESPGRGLSTVVDLTYNSLDDKKKGSPVGNNWSLAISSLTRFGEPLDIRPNKADDLAGRAGKSIEFTDGDGTTHRFTGRQAADGSTYWEEPAGVHLYLRRLTGGDARKKWALTRPDRTTFFYDEDGFPTEVQDGNGNRMVFTLEAVPNKEDPHGPAKRITAVTDAAGNDASPAADRSFRLSYFSKDEAKKPQIRGKVKRIADHNGSALDFEYYQDGNLRRLIQRGGKTAAGEFLADRVFVFTYTTSSGAGPAIESATARANPDEKTSNQSTRLFSVRDPRGKETQFTYLGPGNGNDRWKIASRRDRAGATTTYGYDTATRRTTVTAPLDRVSKYDYDAQGTVLEIRNPKDELTQLAWSADRQVEQVTEPGGGLTRYRYDQNGYITERAIKVASNPDTFARTTMTYEHPAADEADVAGRWKAGRDQAHISQLASRVEPKGNDTPAAGDYEWAFDYDERGNLLQVVDQADQATTYTYDANGCPRSETDARQNTTTYAACDANGLPTSISDALGNVTRFEHDADGLLRWVQDPRHAGDSGPADGEYRTKFLYDSFQRLGRQSTPKSTRFARGTLIWSGAEFDANDNLVEEYAPGYGAVGAKTTTRFDDMDRADLLTGPDRTADSEGERAAVKYDVAGRVEKVTKPKGVATAAELDYATTFEYDKLDRVVTETRYETDAGGAVSRTLRTHRCYDLAGDLVSITAPKADLAAPACDPQATPAHTTRFTYDNAHRPLSKRLPGKPASSQSYDANGNVDTTTDQLGAVSRTTYDERDMVVRSEEPFSSTRKIYSEYEYDAVGNLKTMYPPRSFSASGGRTSETYATDYTYDAANRMTRMDLPPDADGANAYVHRAYDANGDVTLLSLPTKSAGVADLPAAQKTVVDYLDTGSVYSSNDPGNPAVQFDYSAEGWQTARVPQDGTPDGRKPMFWQYYVDGQVREETAADGNKSQFFYDANNNLVQGVDESGASKQGQDAITSLADYDGLDRPVTVTQETPGRPSRQTIFTYDRNGNVETRLENKELGAGGAAGRGHRFVYDQAGWLQEQFDDGPDKDAAADDRKVEVEYYDNGEKRLRRLLRLSGGSYVPRQTTQWSYFANGQLSELSTRRGDASAEIVNSHRIDYVDGDGRYVDGNPVNDTFRLRGPKADAPCRDADCTNAFAFDPRGRLIKEMRLGRPSAERRTSFTLDAAGNVKTETRESRSPGAAVWTETQTATSEYQGNQLIKRTLSAPGASALETYYGYDPRGNLCATSSSGPVTGADCNWSDGAAKPAGLVTQLRWDSLNRLSRRRSFTAGDAVDRDSAWEYDAMDRRVAQRETHGDGADQKQRATTVDYIGLTSQVAREQQRDANGGIRWTRIYSYDPSGLKTGVDDRRPSSTSTGDVVKERTYVYDPRDSVVALIDENGAARAQYGYGAYGEEDEELTEETGFDGQPVTSDARSRDPENSYRYTAKRYDSGAGDLDMGARRFSPQTGRFLQEDFYAGALENLGLASDPLTANRYSLAGGNPVSFIELDGHEPATSFNRRAEQRMNDRDGDCIRDCGPAPATANNAPDEPDWFYQRGRRSDLRTENPPNSSRAGSLRTSNRADTNGYARTIDRQMTRPYDANQLLKSVFGGSPLEIAANLTPQGRLANLGRRLFGFATRAGRGAAKAGEEGLGGASRTYVNITRSKSSIRNVGTDATHTEFAENLTAQGWSSRTVGNGKATLFEKDGARYSLREGADSYDGWTAEFTPAGARQKTLKIRLGWP